VKEAGPEMTPTQPESPVKVPPAGPEPLTRNEPSRCEPFCLEARERYRAASIKGRAASVGGLFHLVLIAVTNEDGADICNIPLEMA
jgi:hypothetical protein